MTDADKPAGQPEALATFAASARNDGHKPPEQGLEAMPETKGKPGPLRDEQDAARRVLAERTTGTDQDADEAVQALPDRISPEKG